MAAGKLRTPVAGRKRGRPQRTLQSRAAIVQAAGTGELPLEYMLRVMRDSKQKIERRDEMAKAAAPYVHPRLSAVEVTRNLSDNDLNSAIDGLAKQLGITIDLNLLLGTVPQQSPTVTAPAAPAAPALPQPSQDITDVTPTLVSRPLVKRGSTK